MGCDGSLFSPWYRARTCNGLAVKNGTKMREGGERDAGESYLGGFLVSILRHEPPGRLGDEPDTKQDDARRDHLDPDGNAPGVGASQVAAPVYDPAGDDGADVPGAVVQASNGAPPTGMRHLAHVARGRYTAKRDTCKHGVSCISSERTGFHSPPRSGEALGAEFTGEKEGWAYQNRE